MSNAPRLKAKYPKDIVLSLATEFKHSSPHQVPRLEEIVVNMDVGEAARNSRVLEGAVADMATITGQKPQVVKTKKSIAQFKLCEGQATGYFATLRDDRIWGLSGRLLSTVLPRIHDFRGFSPKQLDGHDNYIFGLAERTVFHEIDVGKIDRVHDMDITVVTTARTNDGGRSLLRLLGSLFKEA